MCDIPKCFFEYGPQSDREGKSCVCASFLKLKQGPEKIPADAEPGKLSIAAPAPASFRKSRRENEFFSMDNGLFVFFRFMCSHSLSPSRSEFKGKNKKTKINRRL